VIGSAETVLFLKNLLHTIMRETIAGWNCVLAQVFRYGHLLQLYKIKLGLAEKPYIPYMPFIFLSWVCRVLNGPH
jgi:hypothetical protein